MCNTCKGSKSNPGSKSQKCNSCQGLGFITMRQGMMVVRTECENCNGEGMKSTQACKTCSGNGSLGAII